MTAEAPHRGEPNGGGEDLIHDCGQKDTFGGICEQE